MMSYLFPNSIQLVERYLNDVSGDQSLYDRKALISTIEAFKSSDLLTVSGVNENLDDIAAQTDYAVLLSKQCSGFSTLSLCASLLELFGFEDDRDTTLASHLLMAAVLADFPNVLPYHNNQHFRKVVLHCARMICAHNYIFDETQNVFAKAELIKLLVAACIHDLGHDGMGNIVDRTYHMARTEERSFHLAEPYLLAVNMSESDLYDIKIMLIGTDASPFGDPIGPSKQMRRAFLYHFGDEDDGGSLDLSDKLSVLKERDDLSLMCMILHEADLMNSIGLDYNITVEESLVVSQEIESVATPEGTLLFLEKTCCGGFYTDSGRYLGQDNFEKIRAKIVQDYENGNEAYSS